MATTSRGLVYPASTDHTRIWEHVENLATSADTAIGTATTPGPICKLTLQANHSIASGANLSVPFGSGSETIKTDASLHSTTVNNTRIIPNKAGYYQVSGIAWWAANTTGQRGQFVGKNGTPVPPEYNWNTTLPNFEFVIPQVSTVLSANGTTDYFELFVFQNSGGALNVLGSASSTRVTMLEVVYLRGL